MKIERIGATILLTFWPFLAVGAAETTATKKALFSAHVDETEVAIGEKIRLNMQFAAPRYAQTQCCDDPLFPKGLDAVKSRTFERHYFGKKIQVRQYTLMSWSPGKYTIPSVTAKWKSNQEADWHTAVSSPVKIKIKSQFRSGESPQGIKNIKGSLFEWRPQLYFAAGAAASVLLFLIFFFKRRSFRHQRLYAEPQPAPAAHVLALQDILALRKKGLESRGLIKEFYFEISLILRRYLENRFSIRAPEMTTEEFLASGETHGVLSGFHRELLQGFLTKCDSVKFAKHTPPSEDNDAIISSALKLIEETKEVEPPRDLSP